MRSAALAARAPYAYAAVVEGIARLVFTAGACPLDAGVATVAVGDVSGRTEQVMANLRVALEAAGADLIDVMKATWPPSDRRTCTRRGTSPAGAIEAVAARA